MNSLIIGTLIALASAKAFAVGPVSKMPVLHEIHSATLSGVYGCESSKVTDAYSLFVSEGSYKLDDPDLFLYGNCDSFTFESGARGFSQSVIADLGVTPLEKVSMYKAHSNQWEFGANHNFQISAKVVVGHTYSLILNTRAARGVMVFSVESVKGNVVKIRYAVKRYSFVLNEDSSGGENYDVGNSEPVRANGVN